MTLPASGNLPRNATVAITVLLMVVLATINIRDGFNAIILGFQLVLLVLPLPGIMGGSIRSAQWLCFLTLFFLVHGILGAFTPGGLVTGIAEALICVLLFVSAIIFIRTSRKPG